MSRRHLANVRGAVEVELVCEMCEKREWIAVAFDDCEKCVEHEAARQSEEWAMADDALVCSQTCWDKFWTEEMDGSSWQDHVVAAAKADPVYAESIFLDGTLPSEEDDGDGFNGYNAG